MRFYKLSVQGFMSFGDAPSVLDFKDGLTLIEGENRDDPTVANNGSGKSALVEAMLWCLYGKTLRGLSGDEVVNLKSKEGAKVALSFEDSHGEAYTVTRSRRGSTGKLSVITRSGKNLTLTEVSATEALVEELLGLDFSTFTRAVVFGQGQLETFASLTDKQMKAVLDRLLGYDQLLEAGGRVQALLKTCAADLYEAKASAVVDVTLQERVKELSDEEAEWDASHALRLKKYKEAASKSLPTQADTTALKAAQETLDSLKSEQKDLMRQVAEARQAVRAAQGALRDAEEAHEKALDPASKDPVCPHCGSEFDPVNAKAHREYLRAKVEERERQRDRAVSEQTAVEALQAAHDRQVAKAEAARNQLQSRIESARASATATERVLMEAMKETNPFTLPHRKLRARLDLATRRAEEAQARVAKLTRREAHLRFLAAMLSDKGDGSLPPLKSLLMESVAPFLNLKLKHYSNRLTGGNITVKFQVQSKLKNGELRDAYRISAVNAHGADVYAGLSGGEKRKVDLAVFFAFQALASARAKEQTRLLVADEVFDALDETAQEVVVALLLEEQRVKDTILVITQNPGLKAHFSRVVTVVKRGGVSQLA